MHLPQFPRRVLDVGTGPGLLPLRLAEILPGECRMYGTDIDVEMIEVMKQLAISDSRIHFIIHGNEHISFRDNSFGCVVSVNALHHFKFPSAMFCEMVRVLEAGGKAVVYDFNPLSLKLRLACTALRLYNVFVRDPAIRALVESVAVSYSQPQILGMVRQAGIRTFEVYRVGIFNALVMCK